MDAKTSEWRAGPNVCRCCLTEGCYKDISTEYFWMGKREVYAEMLADTLNVSISYSQSGGPNSNSRLICELCISRLRDASDFKRQVLECEKSFTQHLDAGASNILELDVTVEPADSDVKLEHVKQEKRLSDDDDDFDDRCGFDDDDDDDLDDQPLTKLATKIPKKETVDILDLLDNSKATEKRKSSTKTKAVPAKKTKSVKKEPVKAGASKVVAKTDKKKKGSANEAEGNLGVRRIRKLKENVSARQMRRRRRANNQLPEESEKRISKTMMRRNAMILLECSTAWAFRWFHSSFYCSYCEAKFVDVPLLRNHVKNNHLNDMPTTRIFSKLTENNMVKVDVAELSCRLCSRLLNSIDSLKDHLLIHGKTLNVQYSDGVLPFKLDEESYTCQMCFAQFLTFAKINEHMNTHFQNYICDSCGKAFVSKSRFRKHVQSHEKGCFPCGECDEVLETRASRMCHIMRIHRKGVRYACPRCPEVFTTYHSRAKHLVEAHDQQRKEYFCNACDKTFETSSKRAGHIRQTHANIEKRHYCPNCPSVFVSKSKLMRHLRTHRVKYDA
nr:zinc finger protein 2 isoform X16 [Helicoverpa armigera]